MLLLSSYVQGADCVKFLQNKADEDAKTVQAAMWNKPARQ